MGKSKYGGTAYIEGCHYRDTRPHLIDFMFHGSGGSDFCSFQKKKKKVGALLRMRTSTNLRRCDAALLEEEN